MKQFTVPVTRIFWLEEEKTDSMPWLEALTMTKTSWLLLPFFEAKKRGRICPEIHQDWEGIDPDFCCLSFWLRIRQNHTLDSPKWLRKRLAKIRREWEEIDPFFCCLFWGNEGRIAKTGIVSGSGSRFQTSVAFLQGLVFRRKFSPSFSENSTSFLFLALAPISTMMGPIWQTLRSQFSQQDEISSLRSGIGLWLKCLPIRNTLEIRFPVGDCGLITMFITQLNRQSLMSFITIQKSMVFKYNVFTLPMILSNSHIFGAFPKGKILNLS